jgi:hypothetical protein
MERARILELRQVFKHCIGYVLRVLCLFLKSTVELIGTTWTGLEAGILIQVDVSK